MTFDELEAVACGEVRLSIQEFYKLTPRQFSNIMKGYRNKEDNLSKERWVIARKLMYASMAPYLNKSVKETDLIPFDWEKDTLQDMSEEDETDMIITIEESKKFWQQWDEKKATA